MADDPSEPNISDDLARMSQPMLEAGIISADGESLAAFYTSAFGFEVVKVLDFPQGSVRRLTKGSAGIKIFEPAEAPSPRSEAPWNTQRGFAYAALHVDDADQAVELAVTEGATVHTEVTEHRPGARMALLKDPDGNVIEILEEHYFA